jgi:indole-3-glycerol phosphate synthase
MSKKNQKFLKQIIEKKRLDILKTQKTQFAEKSEYLTSRESNSSSFMKIFDDKNKDRIKLIAEIKIASPMNPYLGSAEKLLERARKYEEVGADAVSIITEKHYFKGDISFVSKVKQHVSLPILQKDFIIDSVQIHEAKKAGADALLLIARLTNAKQLEEFVDLCFALQIEPVVEINNKEDLEKAVSSPTNIIAVNARDLDTLKIDVQNACLLVQKIPDSFIKLGFSGIQSAHEVLQYKNAGAKGVLVGTSLMKTKGITGFIKSLQL